MPQIEEQTDIRQALAHGINEILELPDNIHASSVHRQITCRPDPDDPEHHNWSIQLKYATYPNSRRHIINIILYATNVAVNHIITRGTHRHTTYHHFAYEDQQLTTELQAIIDKTKP